MWVDVKIPYHARFDDEDHRRCTAGYKETNEIIDARMDEAIGPYFAVESRLLRLDYERQLINFAPELQNEGPRTEEDLDAIKRKYTEMDEFTMDVVDLAKYRLHNHRRAEFFVSQPEWKRYHATRREREQEHQQRFFSSSVNRKLGVVIEVEGTFDDELKIERFLIGDHFDSNRLPQDAFVLRYYDLGIDKDAL